MKCDLCDGAVFKVVFDYDRPDKYEKWMGIKSVSRQWAMCVGCGVYYSFRNYDIKKLEGIYKSGYRNTEFRGESIEDSFKNIMSLPNNQSENRKRCNWLMNHTEPCVILDIGAGLGVFPTVMDRHGYIVECVEENLNSISFLRDMGFRCYNEIPNKRYDIISLVNVLEHISNPIGLLKVIRKNVAMWLFVEVPYASEFSYLDKDSDEFNSCHLMFYTKKTLAKTLEMSGYKVKHMDARYYATRKLSRILALCR